MIFCLTRMLISSFDSQAILRPPWMTPGAIAGLAEACAGPIAEAFMLATAFDTCFRAAVPA